MTYMQEKKDFHSNSSSPDNVIAIFSAISQGYKDFSAMALITQDGAFPCGSCRQIIHEYAGNIPIYISNGSNEYITKTISELLPYPFG